MMRRLPALAMACVLLSATSLRAQSLFGTKGLGLPIIPMDARAEALGGIGTGLLGENMSLVNPADVAGIGRRSVSAVFQPTTVSMRLGGLQDRRGATDFPLIRIAYPLSDRLVGSVGLGSFLDQNWAVSNDGTQELTGQTVNVHDVLRSTGGVSQVQLGAAYSVSSRFALGVALGLYTGEVQRRLTRSFTDTAAVTNLAVFTLLQRWSYRGPLAAFGVRLDPLRLVRIAGSVTWSGDIKAHAEDPGTFDFSAAMPVQVSGGIGALLAPTLQANFGIHWAGWGRAAGDRLGWDTTATAMAAVNTMSMGGGLEWTGLQSATRAFPIRLGVNFGQLPYQINGATPRQWSAALGFGLRVAPSQVGPGALVDVSLEHGQRGSTATTGLREAFWRFTLSLSLFGR
jgi:hypothetical protein